MKVSGVGERCGKCIETGCQPYRGQREPKQSAHGWSVNSGLGDGWMVRHSLRRPWRANSFFFAPEDQARVRALVPREDRDTRLELRLHDERAAVRVRVCVHARIARGHVECARLLLEAGADAALRATDGIAEGKTALEVAEKHGKAEVAALLAGKSLAEYFAQLSQEDKGKCLTKAAAHGHAVRTVELLEAGPRAVAADEPRHTDRLRIDERRLLVIPVGLVRPRAERDVGRSRLRRQ